MEEFMFFICFAIATGSFMYLITCTDRHSKSPFGYIRRFMFNAIPNLLKLILGYRIFRILQSISDFFFYKNHCLVQILYFFVTWGGFLVYLFYGLIPHLMMPHLYIGSIMFIYCNYTYYQACTISPGIITQENQDEYIKKYEKYYDDVLYLQNNECSTCHIIKPARSKHCRVCNKCISRFDHHCIWIRQCVGQKNYKYFLKFILLHAIFCDYGGVIGFIYFYQQSQLFYNIPFKNAITNEIYKNSYYHIIRHLFIREQILFFMILICILFGGTLTLFIIYHIAMIRYDRTTNERVKRSEFKQYCLREFKKLNGEKPTEEEKERFKKMRKCWESLNKQRYLGLLKGLKLILIDNSQ